LPRRTALAFGLLAMFLGLAAPRPDARAGTLHPGVAAELDRLAPGEQASVLLILSDQAAIPALNHALRLQRAPRQDRHRQVVEALRDAAASSQAPLLAELETMRAGGEVSDVRPYWIANLVRVTGTRGAIERLAARADVAAAEPVPRPVLIEPVRTGPDLAPQKAGRKDRSGVPAGLRAIQADRVWSELGINGQGALIGGLDTGVDGTHPAVAARWRGNNGHPWQECWLDVLGTQTQYPNDTSGHGSHTMGTMTGLGADTQDTVGVAWGATWIAANAIGQSAQGDFDTDIITCFQWFTDPDGDPGTIDDVPDVVQNSWGVREQMDSTYVDCFDLWWQVIDNCEAAGVVVIFSAGNEGPDPASLRSPSDRATTPVNILSVGAVDATNYEWPYPIEDFSSRGPTLCPVAPELLIKPEIAAPGDSVYSSTRNGMYGFNSGTSMAGPHVSGVVALMRSAHPDLDVDTIKQILLDTARDEGAPGEDNDYGWGFLDAYEAVVRCLGGGYGAVAGTITNNDGGGIPVPFGRVRLVENLKTFTADAGGNYWGLTMPGTFTLEATHPSFATQVRPGVVVLAEETSTEDFALEDIAPPALANPYKPEWIENPALPIRVRIDLTDLSPIPTREVVWRSDLGDWTTVPLTPIAGDRHEAEIPPQAVGSRVDFYFRAVDAGGNVGVHPAGAPAAWHEIPIHPVYFADDAETDEGWVLFQAGDANNGRWVRQDPWGTKWQGMWIEPPDDHTPEFGERCFVTGAGSSGGTAGQSDVDAGCVTLTSPMINLAGLDQPVLKYWRWFAMGGPSDASFEVRISNNGGFSWTTLETLTSMANEWTQASWNVASILTPTSQMKLRFIACDTGQETLVEGAVDDVVILGPMQGSDAPAHPEGLAGPSPSLQPGRPNPFARETELRFRIGVTGPARLLVFDSAGRRVRTLLDGRVEAGEHALRWDGRDDSGHRAPSGVYFYELRTAAGSTERKLLLLRE